MLLTCLLALMWTGTIYGADPSPITSVDATDKALNQPNIVLVISDDDDYEHFGFMGSTIAQTPNKFPLLRRSRNLSG
jgi:hypothetical protein